MARKRYKFQCYDDTCYGHKDPYALPRELEDAEGDVVVQCPYCEKEAIVTLGKTISITPVFKSMDALDVDGESVLPDVIPTEPLPEEAEDENDA